MKQIFLLIFIIFILIVAGGFFFSAFYRRLRLKRKIPMQKSVDKRITRFRGIMRAIRGIKQLITKVKDREKLLQGVCDNLVETREYHSAWIVLMKENGSFIDSAQTGIEAGFSAMIDKLKSGEMTRCIRKVIKQSSIPVVTNPAVECSDCSLAVSCADKARMVTRLRYKNRFYGFFAVIVPLGTIMDEEEQSLFDELAGDVSFALYAIETEAEREQDEKKLQEVYIELKKAQLHLVQSEKMEAVGRMASGVAHEVKNPLAIIMQGINYFEEEFPLTQKDNREIIQMMKESVNKADSIVRTLLDFSRVTEIEIKPEDINSILEDSLLLVEHRGKLKGVEIIKELEKDIPKVQANRGKIEQMFVNLFLNAIYAMPNGGKLCIRLYLLQLDKVGGGVGSRKTDSFRLGEKGIVIEIEDTGSGISKENMDKIFDPFFTTKERTEGTGLGLTITKNIIELHKGIINIESERDKGTKVIVMLKPSGGG